MLAIVRSAETFNTARQEMRKHGLQSSQTSLLELISRVASRPAHHCLHRRSFLNAPVRTNSTSAPPKPSISSSSPPPIAPAPQAPLHMLLDSNPSNTSAISKIPIPSGDRGEKFTPSPLSRPLGLPYPPLPGQNAPHSELTWLERRGAYVDPANVQARRKLLLRGFLRPYFQEWKRLDHWKGKSFVAPQRLFKREKALYFPNLWGWTLEKDGAGGKDMTPVLRGRVSLVALQSGIWAEEQVKTFLGEKENPELAKLMEENRGLLQRVDANIQDHWFREWLLKLFKSNVRKMRPETDWGRYFTVRLSRDTGKGLTEDIRDAIGLLNSQVGYVYLLDGECRVRWAASALAWDGEIENLNAGVKRLIEEVRQSKLSTTKSARAAVPVRSHREEKIRTAIA